MRRIDAVDFSCRMKRMDLIVGIALGHPASL
jgi:hypothetical protein